MNVRDARRGFPLSIAYVTVAIYEIMNKDIGV